MTSIKEMSFVKGWVPLIISGLGLVLITANAWLAASPNMQAIMWLGLLSVGVTTYICTVSLHYMPTLFKSKQYHCGRRVTILVEGNAPGEEVMPIFEKQCMAVEDSARVTFCTELEPVSPLQLVVRCEAGERKNVALQAEVKDLRENNQKGAVRGILKGLETVAGRLTETNLRVEQVADLMEVATNVADEIVVKMAAVKQEQPMPVTTGALRGICEYGAACGSVEPQNVQMVHGFTQDRGEAPHDALLCDQCVAALGSESQPQPNPSEASTPDLATMAAGS